MKIYRVNIFENGSDIVNIFINCNDKKIADYIYENAMSTLHGLMIEVRLNSGKGYNKIVRKPKEF